MSAKTHLTISTCCVYDKCHFFHLVSSLAMCLISVINRIAFQDNAINNLFYLAQKAYSLKITIEK